jgi:hypothetical protein
MRAGAQWLVHQQSRFEDPLFSAIRAKVNSSQRCGPWNGSIALTEFGASVTNLKPSCCKM